jgi:RNA polymerase sigma-70 factor (sigma-E family)
MTSQPVTADPGDRDAAFTAFVQSRGTALARSAYLVVGDAVRAEDVLQSAFAETFLRWDTLRRPEAAEAYVRRVIVTTNAAWWRRRSSGETPQAVLPDQVLPDAAPGVVEREVVLDALRQLSSRQRAVIVLRYFDDLTESETAGILGCSVGSVKRHTSRAFARLRVLLGESGTPEDPLAVAMLTAAKATP